MPREAMPRTPARRKDELAEQQTVIDGHHHPHLAWHIAQAVLSPTERQLT
jgi:hypothetical protein